MWHNPRTVTQRLVSERRCRSTGAYGPNHIRWLPDCGRHRARPWQPSPCPRSTPVVPITGRSHWGHEIGTAIAATPSRGSPPGMFHRHWRTLTVRPRLLDAVEEARSHIVGPVGVWVAGGTLPDYNLACHGGTHTARDIKRHSLGTGITPETWVTHPLASASLQAQYPWLQHWRLGSCVGKFVETSWELPSGSASAAEGAGWLDSRRRAGMVCA